MYFSVRSDSQFYYELQRIVVVVEVESSLFDMSQYTPLTLIFLNFKLRAFWNCHNANDSQLLPKFKVTRLSLSVSYSGYF